MTTPSELEILTKSFNRLENYVTKYIYKKYIESITILEEPIENKDIQSNIQSNIHSNIQSNIKSKPIKYKYSAKVNNEDEYNDYLHTIFSQERKSIITQSESLNEDLESMRIADAAYKQNPVGFHYKDYNSLPDVKRCSFISKNKNKYKRCGNNIMNDDSDMCYRHIDSLNIYWDRWCEIIEEITKIN